MDLPFDPTIPLLGIYPKELKHEFERLQSSYVHCSVIYNCQDMEAAQVSISRRVDKKTVVHLHNELLLSHEKEGNLIFSAKAWVDLESIVLK